MGRQQSKRYRGRRRKAQRLGAAELRELLVDTCDEYETDRAYLGMSQMRRCERALYDGLVAGSTPAPTTREALMCHEGYLHEDDVAARFGRAGHPLSDRGKCVVASFDGRFRGHIDGTCGQYLIEIKSVSESALRTLRRNGSCRTGDNWQVQTYMRWGGWRFAFIVYKSRQTGNLWIAFVKRDFGIAETINNKARAILAAVDAGEPPKCTCGRCA